MADGSSQGSGYAPLREVRFATVMYGGVSLAIYINGVAQELFRLVRATAPADDGSGLWLSDDELQGSERVYREIGRRLRGENDWIRDADVGAGTPVASRFVVDILSGTSAGGINAIYLAKALANGQDFDALRRLWVDEADIDVLLNEPRAFKGLRGSARYVTPPASLLAGPRLYDRALRALEDMAPDPAAAAPQRAPRYADEIDLAVTTTDLQGLWVPIRLADRAVKEPRHRAVLRFLYATAQATGQDRNDFHASNDAMLALAARATSSFPFAFEPVLPQDADGLADDAGRRFFGDYVRARVPWRAWAFADGGYLDNKPFTHATSALRRRRADMPVDRKLLYIEPDPARVPDDGNDAHGRPNVFGAVGGAVILPRAESIRDDVVALLERNAAIERIRGVTRGIELAALAPGTQLEAPLPAELAYLRLRRLEVVEDLTELVLRVAGQPPDGDEARFVAMLLQAWPAADTAGLTAEDEHALLTAFLERFDLRYRLRAMTLVLDRIDDLLLRRGSAELLAAAGSDLDPAAAATTGGAWLRDRKAALNRRFVTLRALGRSARARDQQADPGSLAAAVGQFGITTDTVRNVVEAPDPLVSARALLLAPETHGAIAAFEGALDAQFGPAMSEHDAALRADLSAGVTGDVEAALSSLLLGYLDCVRMVDMTTLPLTYPGLRETNPVEIFRVSPLEATSILDPVNSDKPRLAGVAIGHFGAFLDRRWREGDLLWGRLDGAERLIDALVPDAQARDALRVRAHAAILRQELVATPELAELVGDAARPRLLALAADDNTGDAALVAYFKQHYAGPQELDADATVQLAGRGARITGQILEGTAEQHRALARPLFWLSRVARLIWGFAELLLPGGTRPANLHRRWANILLLAGLLLLAAGIVLGIDGAQETGWTVVGATLAVVVGGWIVRADFRRRALVLGGAAVALVLVLLAAFGVLELAHRGFDEIGDRLGL